MSEDTEDMAGQEEETFDYTNLAAWEINYDRVRDASQKMSRHELKFMVKTLCDQAEFLETQLQWHVDLLANPNLEPAEKLVLLAMYEKHMATSSHLDANVSYSLQDLSERTALCTSCVKDILDVFRESGIVVSTAKKE